MVVSLVLGTGAMLCACERPKTEVTRTAAPSVEAKEAVARVGNREIGAEALRGQMILTGVSAEESLEDLVAEELLLHAAQESTLSLSPAFERELDRRMVRALLHELEAENTPESLSKESVQAAYRESKEARRAAERRTSWHILVPDTSSAGKERAAQIVAEIRRASDADSVFEKYRDRSEGASDETFVVEQLPAMTRKGRYEKSFKDAVFERETRGVVNSPVPSSAGWHAVVVTEIQREEAPSFSEAEAGIREGLASKARFEALVGLVNQLEEQVPVTYRDGVVEQVLSVHELPRGAD